MCCEQTESWSIWPWCWIRIVLVLSYSSMNKKLRSHLDKTWIPPIHCLHIFLLHQRVLPHTLKKQRWAVILTHILYYAKEIQAVTEFERVKYLGDWKQAALSAFWLKQRVVVLQHGFWGIQLKLSVYGCELANLASDQPITFQSKDVSPFSSRRLLRDFKLDGRWTLHIKDSIYFFRPVNAQKKHFSKVLLRFYCLQPQDSVTFALLYLRSTLSFDYPSIFFNHINLNNR